MKRSGTSQRKMRACTQVTISHKWSQRVTNGHNVCKSCRTWPQPTQIRWKNNNAMTELLHNTMCGSMQLHPHGSVRNSSASISGTLAVERFVSFTNKMDTGVPCSDNCVPKLSLSCYPKQQTLKNHTMTCTSLLQHSNNGPEGARRGRQCDSSEDK